MQAFRTCSRRCQRQLIFDLSRRAFSFSATSSQSTSSSSSLPSPAQPLPWFVDPSELAPRPTPKRPTIPIAPLPVSIQRDSPIAALHAALSTSPHLEPGSLVVREPIPTADGPPLPDTPVKGRRKRGRTYAGEGVAEFNGGIWSWIIIAQVKEGTEDRGAIESVIRTVRKTLLVTQPPLPLPPNPKRRMHNGWALIDAGDFAIHVVSKEIREQYFPERREW
ncbi:uncharacterized protein LAESUDRAFT_747263 [Laetiporus sulphureus 93-53]|uniref:Uncharacterized protein n=1 Tax=Laetiporus sulphureus 93-53 TaxID=1314785 RepID=A0A165HE51_9APHY|nr:uncharacterized protein LAESUDRAFT_747263 [Laetiporus sulphureus 93-53]KZT11615.1 hypothetical protein LAESUDRAFT_747263 [Laetiporus sulphureus 93-53]